MSPQFRLSLRRAVGILALALFSSLPAACTPLSDAMRQADPRLQKRVTLVASHILIGELLEKLSAQSGVSLTVGEKDGAGDGEVLVSLKDVPLLEKESIVLYMHQSPGELALGLAIDCGFGSGEYFGRVGAQGFRYAKHQFVSVGRK